MKRLQWLMSRYTGYVGVTNHMGEKFEATTESFTPVLEELKRRGLLYVDDGSREGFATSRRSQAPSVSNIPWSMCRSMAGDIGSNWPSSRQAAKERGAAIGVVRLKPATVKQLADWAGKLEGKGLVLVPVSAAVRSQRPS